MSIRVESMFKRKGMHIYNDKIKDGLLFYIPSLWDEFVYQINYMYTPKWVVVNMSNMLPGV
jgi:hypothetical protein